MSDVLRHEKLQRIASGAIRLAYKEHSNNASTSSIAKRVASGMRDYLMAHAVLDEAGQAKLEALQKELDLYKAQCDSVQDDQRSAGEVARGGSSDMKTPSTYPDPQTYSRLYARYLDFAKTEHLVELAEPLMDKLCLDLCCGDGRLGILALARGARRVVFVDKEPRMLDYVKALTDTGHYEPEPKQMFAMDGESVEQFFERRPGYCYDIAFCQQGVNYWLNEDSARLVANAINAGGLFIFNTFSECPSRVPTTKQYHHSGKNYVEVSWLMGSTVHHVQIREGMLPHHTSFRWISLEEYENWLSPYFEMGYEQKGRSLIVRCTRKA